MFSTTKEPYDCKFTNELKFKLNGDPITIKDPDPELLLVHWLRESGYTGTKFSCGQGGCGACTVIIYSDDKFENGEGVQPTFRAINSCLRPLVAMHNMEVLTVEGIGSMKDLKLDPVQEALAKFNGSQCGYCTPGFVCGMKAYLLNTEASKESRNIVDIEDAFDGHLCRCTGYRPILCALKTFSSDGNKEELEHTPPLVIDPSCTYSKHSLQHSHVHVERFEGTDAPVSVDTSYPMLKVISKPGTNRSFTWIKVNTLEQLMALIQDIPKEDRQKIHFVVGNTAYGIQPFQDKIKKQTICLYIADIPDLGQMSQDGSSMIAGAAVSLQSLFQYCRLQVENNKKMKMTKKKADDDLQSSFPLEVLYNHMKRLATTEVRNAGSLAGNLYLAKMWRFPSDLACVLMTLDAAVIMQSTGHPLRPSYSIPEFISDKVALDGTNVIHSIVIPRTASQNVFTRTYKVAARPQNSHPLLNGGFSAQINRRSFEDVRIVFGNLGQKTQRMPQTEKWMKTNCTPQMLSEQYLSLLSELEKELKEVICTPPGMENLPERQLKRFEEFRMSLARNMFLKYMIELCAVFKLPSWNSMSKLKSAPESLIYARMDTSSSGCQDFCVYPNEAPVSEPIVKQSIFLQTTGEAKYTQDAEMGSQNLYHGVYILNMEEAYAKFTLDIPPDFKEKFPDVVKIFTADDVNPSVKANPTNKEIKLRHTHLLTERDMTAFHSPSNRNDLGRGQEGFPGDTLFAKEKVIYIGQPIGMVVSKSESSAREAAQWLQQNAVKFKKLSPTYLTLEEALERSNFFYDKTNHPSAPSRLKKVSHPTELESIDWSMYENDCSTYTVVEGVQSTDSQYHFYMETQSALAYPQEGGKIKVISSAQSPASVQATVGQVCDLPMNSVVIEIPRIGGGYGGKEVQSKYASAAAAFCAHKLNKPVRVALHRTEDMHMIGKRHAVFGKYRVAATKDGKIIAMELNFFADGGCTYDCSFPVMDLILLVSDNAYKIPKFLAQGEVCMTNKATSTAFRSFGVVQGMLIVEAAVEAIAEKLNIHSNQLREINFYKKGDYTPYGQQLLYCNLDGVWETILESSNYHEREKAVKKFNLENKFKKRAIKLIPLKYGISFTRKMSNQGGALLQVYQDDGRVLLNFGGVEMGQGLNTKMMQIAAFTLNIPLEYIEVSNTATDKVPNPVSTGASTGSDLNGGAVKNACVKLKKRLEDCIDEYLSAVDPSISFVDPTTHEFLLQWYKTRKWYFPDGKNYWPCVAHLAYSQRVSLSSTGFFKSADLVAVSNESPLGRPFYYFNYAAAVSEVEVDTLTGECTILRSDIVYDAGHSLNPAIDIGQIEGGFVMGVGYVLTEKLIYDKNGKLFTDGTWEYKPPDTKTVPLDMRVTIYPGANHKEHARPIHRISHASNSSESVKIDPHGIQSSKATGEPPLVLANSVFFAVKDAIKEARLEAELSTPFELDSPATVRDILLACRSDISISHL